MPKYFPRILPLRWRIPEKNILFHQNRRLLRDYYIFKKLIERYKLT